jgi:hypothetical protein
VKRLLKVPSEEQPTAAGLLVTCEIVIAWELAPPQRRT